MVKQPKGFGGLQTGPGHDPVICHYLVRRPHHQLFSFGEGEPPVGVPLGKREVVRGQEHCLTLVAQSAH